jgi:hypothetical protein
MPALSSACLVALGRTCGRSLLTLDVSMCRGFGDEALGALVNGCPRLARLVIFGCTQLTGLFFLAHARAGAAQAQAAAPPCAMHPDLAWAALELIGRPGEPLPPPADESEDHFFP